MFSKLLFFLALISVGHAVNMCVWYRSAPVCGHGSDCPNIYPYLQYQSDSSSNGNFSLAENKYFKFFLAQYCSASFGSKCWSGEKNLCCNANVNLQDTSSYICGSY